MNWLHLPFPVQVRPRGLPWRKHHLPRLRHQTARAARRILARPRRRPRLKPSNINPKCSASPSTPCPKNCKSSFRAKTGLPHSGCPQLQAIPPSTTPFRQTHALSAPGLRSPHPGYPSTQSLRLCGTTKFCGKFGGLLQNASATPSPPENPAHDPLSPHQIIRSDPASRASGKWFTLSSGDHVSRSEQLLWGNQILAGLGSHWAGVRASVITHHFFLKL